MAESLPQADFSEETMKAAKTLVLRISAHSGIDPARDAVRQSLIANDGMSDVYFSEPQRFTQACVEAVTQAQKKSSVPAKIDKDMLTAMFEVEYSAADHEMANAVAEKKEALTRVREGLPEVIGKTLKTAPEYLATGIAGFLAQNAVPRADGVEKALQAAREKDAQKAMLDTLKLHVADAIAEMPESDRGNALLVTAKIMSDVVLTDSYMLKLQANPPYLSRQAAAVGG